MRSRVFFLAAIAGNTVGAQTTPRSVPVRTVAPVVASTKAPLQEISSGVRELPGRRVLINDAEDHRLLLFDSTLTTFTAIRDSVSGATGYGPLTSNVIPYLGDSSLFVDNPSSSFLVVDPDGKVGRVIALPSARDINTLRRGVGPATDPLGRLVYRGPTQGQFNLILRANFDTRRVDTIGRYKVTGGRTVTDTVGGRERDRRFQDPMPMIDDWAMMADGSIAIVRGNDYHIDWIDLDGKMTPAAKMPHDWRQVTDAEKQLLLDSARARGVRSDSIIRAAEAVREAQRRSEGRAPVELAIPERHYLPREEISDYFPPIRPGAVRADRDNNLWILPTTSAESQAGELVYDVVNRRGELVERVRLPAGRSIAGFGRGGAIYMMWRDARGWFIERTTVLRPGTTN